MIAVLTSTGFSNERIYQFVYKWIVDKRLETAAIIVTASREKAKNKYAQRAMADLKKIATIKEVNFFDADCDDPKSLEDVDVVYVCGGNTFDLMHSLNKSMTTMILLSFFSKNTLYIGVSAGSCILGEDINHIAEIGMDQNNYGTDLVKPLGILPLKILPHSNESWRSEMLKQGYNKYLEIPDGTGIVWSIEHKEILEIIT